MLVMMICDLQAGTMKLCNVIGVNRQPNFKEFTLFFKIAHTFGGGYLDDVDFSKFNNRNSITHREQFILLLRRVVTAFDFTLIALEMQQKDDRFNFQFTKLILFCKKMFANLIVI